MENEDAAPAPPIDWGVAARPLPGEAESGDLHLVMPIVEGVLVAVVDGSGHGPEAADAARIAVAALEGVPNEPIISKVTHCHERLKGTRGVAMTLASISLREGSITWLGVGNVEGVLFRANSTASPLHEYVVQRGGVVGVLLPPLHASTIPVGRGDTLILATDGIQNRFTEHLKLSDPPQEIADHVLATCSRSTDDALVLVARYLGAAP